MAPSSSPLAAALRRAIIGDPGQASALNHAIEASFQNSDMAQVASWSRRALAAGPGNALPLVALGHAARGLDPSAPPSPWYRRAAALEPHFESAWTGLGAAFLASEQDDEALRSFRRALDLAPFSPVAAKNLAEALRVAGQPDKALRPVRRAIALAPNYSQSHYNLGLVEYEMRAVDRAARYLSRTLALLPNDTDARYALGAVELQRGRFARGWMGYEARWGQRTAPKMRPFALPQWNGDSISGALLLWGEQGLGDEIFLASLVPEAASRADRVVVECDPRLVPIMSRSFSRISVVARSDPPDLATRAKDIVAQCPFGTLPLHLRTDLGSFHREAFLKPDPLRQAAWRTWLNGRGPGLKVGFAWRSSRSDRQARYYHPPIEVWRPLFSVPGITWIPLQYGNFRDEMNDLLAGLPSVSVARPDLDLFNDLEGILALGASLDLMISTGTTAGFLPAAAGTETWMSLPYRDYLFRIGTSECPWFARTHIVTVNDSSGWKAAADNIARDLGKRAELYRR